jgi:hypothetical protein
MHAQSYFIIKKKISDEKYNQTYPSLLTNCSLGVNNKRLVNSI